VHDGLLFLHILGAAAWIGGGIYGYFSYPALVRLGPPTAEGLLKGMEKWGAIYFGSASGLVVLSGIGLVLTSDAYDWSDTFVLIGLGAFIASGVIQSTIGKKANERVMEAAVTGAGIPEAIKTAQQAGLWDFVVLFVTLWAMITKLGV
jgi:hypothetical protein